MRVKSYLVSILSLMAMFASLASAQIGERPKLVLEPKALLKSEPAQWSLAPTVPRPITRKEQRRVVVNWTVKEMKSEIAPGVIYDDYWGFEGHVPGPILRVREGDLVEIHLSNHMGSLHSHNIDFHFVSGPGGGASSLNVAPGETQVLEARAMVPGFYMFHCASPDIPTHIANGMYGFVIVEPAEGLPQVDREYYIVQSELYTKNAAKGHQTFSMERGEEARPEYVVFNGSVGSMMGSKALKAGIGETVRLWVGNAGPNFISSFHVIGQIFSNVYREGDLLSPPGHGIQTTLIPAGGSAVVEFSSSVPGTFLAVDHAIFRLHRGAAASIMVDGAKNAEIFDPITAGEKAMAMSDKDHVAGPPSEATRLQHGNDLKGSLPVSVSAQKSKANVPKKRKVAKRAMLTGPVTSITAANFASTTTIALNEDTSEEATSGIGGNVLIKVLPGSGNYSTDPAHSFSPSRITIKAGTTVTLLNTDDIVHQNKDDKGEFQTPLLRAGMSFTHTFKKPGTYNYQCIQHAWMKGTIIVR